MDINPSNLSGKFIWNQINKNERMTQHSLEQLSSGMRINHAGDDAAGLTISEKMRGQIRGLSQANRNMQDAISLVQTAEAGMSKIHDQLQRMRELYVSAANGTLTDHDRDAIQEEVTQLVNGIDETANHTHFNGIKLLNVSPETYSSSLSAVDISKAESIDVWESTGGMPANHLATIQTSAIDNNQSVTINVGSGADLETYEITLTNGSTNVNDSNWVLRLYKNSNPQLPGITAVRLNGIKDFDKTSLFANQEAVYTWGTMQNQSNILGEDINEPLNLQPMGTAIYQYNLSFNAHASTGSNPDAQLKMQIGANGSQMFDVQLTDLRAATLGVDQLSFSSSFSIDTIDEAIGKVSSERARFGAYQNRIDHAINQSSNAELLLTDAESRIRDTDIAKEMLKMASKNMLNEASQTMLAQANLQSQYVLLLVS